MDNLLILLALVAAASGVSILKGIITYYTKKIILVIKKYGHSNYKKIIILSFR